MRSELFTVSPIDQDLYKWGRGLLLQVQTRVLTGLSVPMQLVLLVLVGANIE